MNAPLAYDVLTPAWRVAYGVLGIVFLVLGGLGTVAEVLWAVRGYWLAWPAAAIAAGITALGVSLLRGVRQGRIRTLGLGAGRGTPPG